jgi:hypothetical protein
LIYLAGPYSIDPDVMYEWHVQEASRLLKSGHIVYSPIAEAHFWQQRIPFDYETWLEKDFRVIDRCDALIRLPGESPGSEREVLHARSIGIPVWEGLDPVADFLFGQRPTFAASALSRIYFLEQQIKHWLGSKWMVEDASP